MTNQPNRALIERLTCEIVDTAQDNGSEMGGAFARKLAITALAVVYEALREPSHEVILAGVDEDQSDDVYRDVAAIYRVMLSASALSSVIQEGE
ncbi:hypothetical protein [Phyllobacterium sp. YR531]|uniref:hypothetical protein n=1 Tax=Phyllobacterium sp. YR531 TaxID=1144343 RepID=UPI00026FC370|nr:hypothetical protein [Phyllobacterium sp. YR531]EJN04290.1 hypothetical protein PMI41_01929 [Phyllobacterium sp. YR531]